MDRVGTGTWYYPVGQELGIVAYLVSPDSLDIDSKQAFGYTVKDEDRTWYLEPIPFPAVFYNRVYTLPNPEAVIRYNLLLTLAEKEELKIYNRSRLDKWRLHQLLQDKQTGSECTADEGLYLVTLG